MSLAVNAWGKSTVSNPSGSCVEAGVWTKSLLSQGTSNCVEAGVWRKSTLSNPSGSCVEATAEENFVLVRDTKVSRRIGDDAPVQSFSLRDWQKLVDAIKRGKLDDYAVRVCAVRLGVGRTLELRPAADGMTEWHVSNQATVHRYTADEMHAFLVGAKQGEFDLTPAMARLAAAAV